MKHRKKTRTSIYILLISKQIYCSYLAMRKEKDDVTKYSTFI